MILAAIAYIVHRWVRFFRKRREAVRKAEEAAARAETVRLEAAARLKQMERAKARFDEQEKRARIARQKAAEAAAALAAAEAAKLRARQESEASRGPFVVAIALTFEGDLSSFDAAAELVFKTRLAQLLDGVNVGDIGMEMSAGSIVAQIRIVVPSEERAEEIRQALANMPRGYLEAALGITLISVSQAVVEPTGTPSWRARSAATGQPRSSAEVGAKGAISATEDAEATWKARPVGLGFELHNQTQINIREVYRRWRNQETKATLHRLASKRIHSPQLQQSTRETTSDRESEAMESDTGADERVVAERMAQWEERGSIMVRNEAMSAAARFRRKEASAMRGLVAMWETAPLWQDGGAGTAGVGQTSSGIHAATSTASNAVAAVSELCVPKRLRCDDSRHNVVACGCRDAPTSIGDQQTTDKEGSNDDYYTVHALIDHDDHRHDETHHRRFHHAAQMLMQGAHKPHKRVLRPRLRALIHDLQEAQAASIDPLGGTRDKDGYWHKREEVHLYGDELEGEHRERINKERVGRELKLARLAAARRAQEQKLEHEMMASQTGMAPPLRSCREGGPDTRRGSKDMPPAARKLHRSKKSMPEIVSRDATKSSDTACPGTASLSASTEPLQLTLPSLSQGQSPLTGLRAHPSSQAQLQGLDWKVGLQDSSNAAYCNAVPTTSSSAEIRSQASLSSGWSPDLAQPPTTTTARQPSMSLTHIGRIQTTTEDLALDAHEAGLAHRNTTLLAQCVQKSQKLERSRTRALERAATRQAQGRGPRPPHQAEMDIEASRSSEPDTKPPWWTTWWK